MKSLKYLRRRQAEDETEESYYYDYGDYGDSGNNRNSIYLLIYIITLYIHRYLYIFLFNI